ncbi:MAG: J domain-containing protein [Peptococcaceae bacterium]|nr:J domain-containing protein [Peptococcaceae bacterium]
MKNYYQTLGVPHTESSEGIRVAFRKKAKLFHPDVCKLPDAHQRFIEVAEAYEILREPTSRAKYDVLLKETRSGASTDFSVHQKKARETANHYSSVSLDDVLSTIAAFTYELGRGIVLGDRDKPQATFGDYARMGFYGLLLIVAIAISFTGVGTLPGIGMFYIVWHSASKDGRFLGLGPFLVSTLVTVAVLLFVGAAIFS